MKNNKLVNWFKNLSKKSKIYYILWIFIPLFIIILVASLLGTTMANYNRQFSPKYNITTTTSANYNQLFTTSKYETNQVSLNYSKLANLLSKNSVINNHQTGKEPNDWTSELENNDFVIYLKINNELNSNYEYLQLINGALNASYIKSSAIGYYNSNYKNNSSNMPYDSNQYANANLKEYYNYAYVSLNNTFFTSTYLSNFTLVVSQIQDFSGQFANLVININF